MSKAFGSIYRMFDYFTGRFEPEDREEYLDALSELKSKDEIISEIITLLQSPAKNVISSLKSGSSKLSGIVKTLAERTE